MSWHLILLRSAFASSSFVVYFATECFGIHKDLSLATSHGTFWNMLEDVRSHSPNPMQQMRSLKMATYSRFCISLLSCQLTPWAKDTAISFVFRKSKPIYSRIHQNPSDSLIFSETSLRFCPYQGTDETKPTWEASNENQQPFFAQRMRSHKCF